MDRIAPSCGSESASRPDTVSVSDSLRAIYDAKVYCNAGNAPLLSLLPSGAKSVLDVGCGAGDNARIMRTLGLRVFGVTLSSAEAKLAASACEQVIIGNAETESLPFPLKSFDVLFLSHVLEHTIHPDRVLTRLAPLLCDQGVALIAVPNSAHYRFRPRLLMGNWQMTETGTFDRTHLHFWSYETASTMLSGTPFNLVMRRPGNPSLPLWPLRRLLPSGVIRYFDTSAGLLFPNLCALQTLLLAKIKCG